MSKYNIELQRHAPWPPTADKAALTALMDNKPALAAAKAKHTNQLSAWIGTLEKEIAALEPKIGAQARAIIKPMATRENCADSGWAMALFTRREQLAAAVAAGPAPAAKPAPIVAKPAAAPVLNATSLGSALIATTTHADPAIRKPAQAALNTIVDLSAQVAAIRNNPDPKARREALRDLHAKHAGNPNVRVNLNTKPEPTADEQAITARLAEIKLLPTLAARRDATRTLYLERQARDHAALQAERDAAREANRAKINSRWSK